MSLLDRAFDSPSPVGVGVGGSEGAYGGCTWAGKNSVLTAPIPKGTGNAETIVEGYAFIDTNNTSSGIKHDAGKPRMELLDSYALSQVALVLNYGAEKKYNAHNWRKGISYGRLLGATLRHVFSFVGGEDLDAESGLPHLAHAMCCLMFVLGMTQSHPELDDRYREDKSNGSKI